MLVARQLGGWGCPGWPLPGLLYLVGLGGDSYYGLVAPVPALKGLYEGIFVLCSYTRNGLFFARCFLLLGAAGGSGSNAGPLRGWVSCSPWAL